MLDPSGAELVLIGVMLALGGFVQASIGLGFALVSAPVIALVEPEAIPVVLLLLAAPLNVFVLARERSAVDRPAAGHVILGMAAGSAAGAAILRAVPQDDLAVLFGAAVLLAVGSSIVHPAARFGGRARVSAGVGAGIINTVAATGGPVVALVFQHREGSALRSTLALAFLAQVVLSVAALAVAREVGWDHVRLALAVTPAVAVGVALTGPMLRVIDRGVLRPAVLTFAALSGAAAIARGLL